MSEGGFVPEGAILNKSDLQGTKKFGFEANPPGGSSRNPEQDSEFKLLPYNHYQTKDGRPNPVNLQKLGKELDQRGSRFQWDWTKQTIDQSNFQAGRVRVGDLAFDTQRLAIGMMATAQKAELNGQPVVKMRYPHVDETGQINTGTDIFLTEGQMQNLRPLIRTELEHQGLLEPRLLDPRKIREALDNGVPLQDLPAINILGNQLDKNQQDILRKAPNAPKQQVAVSLATRFKEVSLYQRIAEQAVFGPKDFERFDDPQKIGAKWGEVNAGLSKAEQEIPKIRPNSKFSQEQGWLYFHQGKKGETAYRIYLSPEATAIGKVFTDIAAAVPENVGYQMKTFDRPNSPTDVARLDKIIIYCSEDNFDTILESVGKVYGQNAADFMGRVGPGGGVISPLEGISIAKQPKQVPGQQEVTGTQDAAKRIKEQLDNKLPQITRESFQKFKTVQAAYQSDEGRLLWSRLLQDQELTVRNLYFPNPPDKSSHSQLAQAYLEASYNMMVRNYVEKRPVSIPELRTTFLQIVRARGIRLSGEQFAYLQNNSPYIYDRSHVSDKFTTAAKDTGLMITFNNALQAGQVPSEAFKQLLSKP